MCGIFGIISLKDRRTPDAEVVKNMGNVMIHRGPDDSGFYMGEGIGLGMRRLSIIDIHGGHQPISNKDRTLWVVCNGEIYNFRELRKKLELKGYEFKTKSDTEVIVHAYDEFGDCFIHHLGGMFGFALWDERKRRLIIGRDRLGIKPIYYYDDGYRLIFASEAKAILTVPGVNTEIDPAGFQEYLTLGYVPAPFSIFKGIKKLPTASLMFIEKGKVRLQRYWNISNTINESFTENDWIDALLEKIESAVVSQMVSDVPMGAFLSGGIDSSAIVGFMAKNSNEQVKTYSIGFDTGNAGEFYNELPYAKQISEYFLTGHKEILVRPNVVKLLPKLLWQMDEPIADSAFITTFLVAEFARKDVTVILAGVGGDEIFGGYYRYLGGYYERFLNLIPKLLQNKLLMPLAKNIPVDRHSPFLNLLRLVRKFILSSDLPLEERYRSYVEVFNKGNLDHVLKISGDGSVDSFADAFRQCTGGDSLQKLLKVDLLTQLPDDLLMLTDKMTMATSLECRVPLLDHELVELVASMPSRFKVNGRQLKFLLKKALSGFLPPDIIHRKKRGFGAPMGAWIKNELASFTRILLSRKSLEKRGIFRPDRIEEILALHETNKEDFTDHLLALINFEIWCRLYLDKQSPEDLTLQIESEAR